MRTQELELDLYSISQTNPILEVFEFVPQTSLVQLLETVTMVHTCFCRLGELRFLRDFFGPVDAGPREWMIFGSLTGLLSFEAAEPFFNFGGSKFERKTTMKIWVFFSLPISWRLGQIEPRTSWQALLIVLTIYFRASEDDIKTNVVICCRLLTFPLRSYQLLRFMTVLIPYPRASFERTGCPTNRWARLFPCCLPLVDASFFLPVTSFDLIPEADVSLMFSLGHLFVLFVDLVITASLLSQNDVPDTEPRAPREVPRSIGAMVRWAHIW